MKNVLKVGSEKDWKLIEAAIVGSFDEIREKVRSTIKASGWFPEKNPQDQYIDTPYIRTMFPDKAIISYNGYLYQISYSIMDKAVILGQPVEVEEAFIIKEGRGDGKGQGGPKQGDGGADKCVCPKCGATTLHEKGVPCSDKKCPKCGASMGGKNIKETDIKEASIVTIREARDEDLTVSSYISLKEAKWNDELSEVEVTLIEAGTNQEKRRHYPTKTIQEAAPLFAGFKMYINHPTKKEEQERPERNLKDWASTIVESRFDNGKAVGKVAIHDAWLRERLKDPIAREHIGLSINTGGKISIGKINGQDMQIVEKIVFARKNGPVSVDWVTEPGARGRVNRLLESRTGGSKMELEQATIKDLKESRTDLVEAIRKENEAGNTAKVTKLEADLKEANAKIEISSKKEKTAAQSTLVEASLKEAKIPDAAKDKVRTHFATNLVEGSEADLKESIGKVIKSELEYANKLTTKGTIKTGEGASPDLKESLGAELDNRAGVAEKKEEKK